MTDEVKNTFQSIFDSSKALVILVADYLDVSRIEQGRMKYDYSTFDLKDLVSQVVVNLNQILKKLALILALILKRMILTFLRLTKGRLNKLFLTSLITH